MEFQKVLLKSSQTDTLQSVHDWCMYLDAVTLAKIYSSLYSGLDTVGLSELTKQIFYVIYKKENR